jgi:hypothetical protein
METAAPQDFRFHTNDMIDWVAENDAFHPLMITRRTAHTLAAGHTRTDDNIL